MVSVARYTTLCLISIKSAEDIMAMHIQWQDSFFFVCFLFFVFCFLFFFVLFFFFFFFFVCFLFFVLFCFVLFCFCFYFVLFYFFFDISVSFGSSIDLINYMVNYGPT